MVFFAKKSQKESERQGKRETTLKHKHQAKCKSEKGKQKEKEERDANSSNQQMFNQSVSLQNCAKYSHRTLEKESRETKMMSKYDVQQVEITHTPLLTHIHVHVNAHSLSERKIKVRESEQANKTQV